MRRSILLLVPLLLLPTAYAHEEDGFGHLTVQVDDLTPGQTRSYHLDPTSGGNDITLSQGWVFGVYGALQGNASDRIHVYLYHEGIPVTNWTWTQGYHGNTTRLRFTGDHELRLHNPGQEKIRYAIYYDQSCNCKGKAIPLPGGWNIFNYDLPKGRDAFFGLPLARTYHVRGALATLSSTEDARWPQDFTILSQAEAKGPQWLNFTFTPTSSQRYYVYVEAIAGAELQRPMDLIPLLEVEPAPSPMPGALPLVFILALGVLVLHSRRSGR